MDVTRREFMETTGFLALGAAMLASSADVAQASDAFDIDAAFASFMTDIGQAPRRQRRQGDLYRLGPDRAHPFPHRRDDGDSGDGRGWGLAWKR